MFPLIVSTIPENGAEQVGLNTVIKIGFDESLGDMSTNLSINSGNIRLVNMNTDEDVQSDIDLVDGGMAIQITPVALTSSGDQLEGLTEYRVFVSNLESAYGEVMFGTFELRFMTEAGSIDDYTEEYEVGQYFTVSMTYPKENAVSKPDVIRIKCSGPIDPASSLTGIMVLEDTDFESLDEAKFIGHNIIAIEDITIAGDVISIDAAKLIHGKRYSVVISDIQDTSENEIEPYFYDFHTTFESFYAGTTEIRNISGFKSVLKDYTDYDIALIAFENSKLAEFIAEEAENYENIDWVGPALFVTRYVTTKTQYDIIFNKVIEMTSGPTQKVLEDLSITYGYSVGDLLKLVDKLKLEYLYWENYLKGSSNGRALPGTFVRGENADEIPDYKSRQLRDRDGTKTW